MESIKKGPNTMGMRMRALRKHRGMTQTILADRVDCSIGTISRVETIDTLDGLSTLVVRGICDVLDCSIDWLVNGNGPSPFDDGAPIDGVLGTQQFDGLDRLRVFNFTNSNDLRYVMITSSVRGMQYRIGEVMVVDCSEQPDNGDEAAAMVNGEVRLMRMLTPAGAAQFVELMDGSREMFDPQTAAWFGTVSGTLSNKRVRAVS
ncbi:helix-turn-helix domain-containing protein [Aeromonas sp. R7-1]|uniref:helix-turn-helix domain-containing protein n=1 Tax=Aeromonas sp. R7-1 TaxID=3138473 RepID=UPI0034A52F90